MNNKSNVEKAIPSKGDGSAAKELENLVASKLDDYTPEGIDIRRVIELNRFMEAVENGFKVQEKNLLNHFLKMS